MDWLVGVDWRHALLPDTPLLEIFLRGTLTYLAIFALLRIIIKREAGGQVAYADVLVLVLIADAAQNAMAGNYNSVPDGVLLVATILFWSYALDWLGYHVPALRRLLRPAPLPLVRDGAMLRRNMRRELITEEELMSQLRQSGAEDLAEVKLAVMESDGSISVVTHDQQGGGGKKGQPAT